MRNFVSSVALLSAAFAGAQTLTVQPNTAGANARTMTVNNAIRVVPVAAASAGLQVTSNATQMAARAPKARPEDVATPEALVQATYAVISGPPGLRDWDRFKSLFLPSGRLTATGMKDGVHVISELSPQEYVDKDSPYFLKNGFFERDIRTRIDRFGSLAVAFSSYESRKTADGEPFVRGINSFQMVSDGSRWWIVSIAWDDERGGQKLPDDMAKR